MAEENAVASSQTAVFPGRFESLTQIVDFVTAAAHRAGLDARAVQAVQLAADEAASNIIEHAYGGEGGGDIECTCSVEPDRLTMTLADRGAPFDPCCVPEPDLGADLDKRLEGGLGVYIMRRLMDELRHEFRPESGNVLTMVKRREGLE